MTLHIRISIQALTCGLFTAVAWGALSSVPDITTLVAGADVVLKGRVVALGESSETIREVSGDFRVVRRSVARVRVDRVFKGTVTDPEILIEVLSAESCCITSLTEGEYSLLFLKSPFAGTYSFSHPVHSKMPISESVGGAGPAEDASLEQDLIASLDDGDRKVICTAAEQLARLNSRNAIPALLRLSESNDPEIRARAHTSLLVIGEYARLAEAAKLVEADNGRGIAEAIASLRDTALAPVMVQMLNSPSGKLRRSAARALRNMRDPSTVPALIQALDDSETDVRYDAMMTLASIEHSKSRPAPSRVLFDRDSGTYLAAWKDWWNAEGSSRYPGRGN